MTFSNRTAQALLNALFGKTSNFGALAAVPTIYVALSSTAPTETGANVTEPGGGSYSRKATAPADWNAATLADPSVVTNAGTITFTTATADWLSAANITHFALYDAAAAGNYLGGGSLSLAKPVLNGDTASFPAGTLQVSLD